MEGVVYFLVLDGFPSSPTSPIHLSLPFVRHTPALLRLLVSDDDTLCPTGPFRRDQSTVNSSLGFLQSLTRYPVDLLLTKSVSSSLTFPGSRPHTSPRTPYLHSPHLFHCSPSSTLVSHCPGWVQCIPERQVSSCRKWHSLWSLFSWLCYVVRKVLNRVNFWRCPGPHYRVRTTGSWNLPVPRSEWTLVLNLWSDSLYHSGINMFFIYFILFRVLK